MHNPFDATMERLVWPPVEARGRERGHESDRTQKRNGRHLAVRPHSAFVYVLILCLAADLVRSSSVNDCRGVVYAYAAKGLDRSDVPRQPRQGSQLQICPRGLTCCTEEMEKKLRSVSKDQYGKAMHASAGSIQKLFNNRGKKFDEYFTDLLVKSKLKFHKLFQKTYGIIYERNSDVFIDFFKDLESYYDHGEVDLEDALKNFFSRLYQRMFTVYNAQHSFDSPYLSCVSQTMKKLQPFGDVPKKLTEQLRRSFVASRTFAQALLEGKQIVNRISRIPPKDECVVALTKMSSCPACQGLPEIKPCEDYCINVMKGCLAFHAELGDSWDKFIENLQTLADRLIGPFDIEAVVDPIGVKISDAIMNFQNSGYDVTLKVFGDCGQPRLHKRQANYGYAYGHSSRRTHQRSRNSQNSGGEADTKLKSLIKDTRSSVNDTRGYWSKLPYIICEDDSMNAKHHGNSRRIPSPQSSRLQRQQDDTSCWNGRDAGRYTSKVVNDGLVYQEQNPEVPVDINRPDVDINEQILALKVITKKLENAHKGQNVDWPTKTSFYMADKSEGSGDGCNGYSDDEDCYEDYDSDTEGSGSGDGSDETRHSIYSSGNENEAPIEAEEEEEEGENWPPWVTAKPASTDDIVVEDGKDASHKKTTSGAGIALKGLLYYLVPIFTCLLGSLVSSL